jgi:hypothetical protein
MIDDYSLLDPSVTGFAAEQPGPGLIRLKIHDVKSHWEPWCAHGDKIYPHLRAADGSVVCDVPHAAVSGLIKAGYVLL